MPVLKYAGLLVIIGLAAYWLMPSSSPALSDSEGSVREVYYLCRETKELVQAPLQPVPAVNPATGKATLYRALYCEKCKAWRAVPPPDVFPQNPLTYPCPKHRRPMAETGPTNNH